MKTRFLIIIGIISIVVLGFFSILYGEFETVPYGSCHLNLQWEYSRWFGIPDYLDQLQRCISNIPFTIQNVFADDDSTVLFLWGDETDPSGQVQWNVGEIYWMQASYSGKENSVATLRVIDPDLIQFPGSDFIRIHVHSDTDPLGTDIILTNKAKSPGFFEGDVIFTHDFSSSRGILLVSDGDTITAKYVDSTLPDNEDSDTYELTAHSIIAGVPGTLQWVLALSLRIEDLKENVISDDVIQVGQQVLFSAELTGQIQSEHDFAYLVQVQDDEGRTVSLSWLSGIILPDQTITSNQSWISDLPGIYFVTVFVWESINNPTSLSPPLSMEFLVQ